MRNQRKISIVYLLYIWEHPSAQCDKGAVPFLSYYAHPTQTRKKNMTKPHHSCPRTWHSVYMWDRSHMFRRARPCYLHETSYRVKDTYHKDHIRIQTGHTKNTCKKYLCSFLLLYKPLLMERYGVLWFWEQRINLILQSKGLTFDKLICIQKTPYAYIGFFTVSSDALFGQLIVKISGKSLRLCVPYIFKKEYAGIIRVINKKDLIIDKRDEFHWISTSQ